MHRYVRNNYQTIEGKNHYWRSIKNIRKIEHLILVEKVSEIYQKSFFFKRIVN